MAIQTSEQAANTPPEGRSDWWRTALGEHPTGVTLVTSLDGAGQPIGMIVGTFNAVSEAPPLVGFMPMRSSRTFAEVAAHGRFIAHVLGSQHEDLCRRIASRDADVFTAEEWLPSTSGIPRLPGAAAWFDATIRDTHEAGDHYIVVAEINEFGAEQGPVGLPLLFYKGGYGSFQIPTLRFDFEELDWRINFAESSRHLIEDFARSHDVAVVLSTVVGDSIAVLAIANPALRPMGARRTSFPFAAPIGTVLAAWAPPEVKNVWIEQSRHLLGRLDRGLVASTLERVHTAGYDVSVKDWLAVRFDAAGRMSTDRSELAAIWAEVRQELRRLEAEDSLHSHAFSIHVPVMGPDGYARVELVAEGFGRAITKERFDHILSGALETAAALGEVMSQRREG